MVHDDTEDIYPKVSKIQKALNKNKFEFEM